MSPDILSWSPQAPQNLGLYHSLLFVAPISLLTLGSSHCVLLQPQHKACWSRDPPTLLLQTTFIYPIASWWAKHTPLPIDLVLAKTYVAKGCEGTWQNVLKYTPIVCLALLHFCHCQAKDILQLTRWSKEDRHVRPTPQPGMKPSWARPKSARPEPAWRCVLTVGCPWEFCGCSLATVGKAMHVWGQRTYRKSLYLSFILLWTYNLS